MTDSFVRGAFQQAQKALEKFASCPDKIKSVENAVSLMVEGLQGGGKIFSCGNGGSLCDSMHFAEELTGRYRKDRKPIPALSLSDPGHMSCVANDFGYSYVFSRLIESLSNPGDILLAISTSGNSENVIQAAHMAKTKKVKTIGLLGKDGGKLKGIVDLPIIVDTHATERIQEIHIKIIHIFIEGIERSFFPTHYS